MKVKITIEIDVDLNDLHQLKYAFKDINNHICNGVQSRASHLYMVDYQYHIFVPIRSNAKIVYEGNKVIYNHKSKIK